ncbi:MAG TPA: hypothetical protein VF368_04215 [Gemmatimonadaceae bacterium]
MIGGLERAAIDCKDLNKPAALPAAFALPDIPLPPDMAKMTGAHPTKFHADYVAAKQAYRFTFSAFTPAT